MGLRYYWSTERKRSANAKNQWKAYVILRLGVEPSPRACYPHSLLWYSRHTYCRYTNGGLDVGGLNMGLNTYVGDKLRWDVCIFIHPFHMPQTMLWIRSKLKGLLHWRVTRRKRSEDDKKREHWTTLRLGIEPSLWAYRSQSYRNSSTRTASIQTEGWIWEGSCGTWTVGGGCFVISNWLGSCRCQCKLWRVVCVFYGTYSPIPHAPN